MTIEFAKYEGAGNDFVVIDNRAGDISLSPQTIAALCDRRFGIGADGAMLLESDPHLDFRMRYFNSDGPEATMCGNGGRCISLFALHVGAAGSSMCFSAVDGQHCADIISVDGSQAVVSLGMADASLPEPLLGGWFVDTGSPHWVGFVDDPDAMDVFAEGRRMRQLREIRERGGANFNFVGTVGGGMLRVRTYERGVEDETLACGTGAVACAATYAAVRRPDLGTVDILARGGRLSVSLRRERDSFRDIRLTGPARRVFTGSFDTDDFARTLSSRR